MQYIILKISRDLYEYVVSKTNQETDEDLKVDLMSETNTDLQKKN